MGRQNPVEQDGSSTVGGVLSQGTCFGWMNPKS